MADGVTFDYSEILKLAADLGEAPVKAGIKIRQAVEITARKVKDDWAQKLEGTPDVPHASRTITYDIDVVSNRAGGPSSIDAEIGSEDGRLQAPIVTVLEFGAPSKNLPPHGYGAAALKENDDDFELGLSLAIADPL